MARETCPFKIGDKLLLVGAHRDYNEKFAGVVKNPMTIRRIEHWAERTYATFEEAHPNILSGGGEGGYWRWSMYTADQIQAFQLIPQVIQSREDLEALYG